MGGRPKTNTEQEALVVRLREEGCSYRSIRKQTGLALSTIRRIIVEQKTIEACPLNERELLSKKSSWK